jgi:hypothetical protein
MGSVVTASPEDVLPILADRSVFARVITTRRHIVSNTAIAIDPNVLSTMPSVMEQPASVAQLIDSMLAKREPSITSTFVAATPFPNIFWVSLQGRHDQTIKHGSKNEHTYQVSIPVAVLTPETKRYLSRATVTLGMFRLLNDARTWKTWEIKDVQVQEDLNTHLVTIEFGLLLDSDSVAAGSFYYTADLYLSV